MFRAILVLALSQIVLGHSGKQYSTFYDKEDSRDFYKRIGAIVRNSSAPWKAGVYSKPPSYFHSGSIDLPPEAEDLPIVAVYGDLQLPQAFDARTRWPLCQSIRDIRNQGCCGSCYAVSAASAMTDRYCIHSHRHETFVFASFEMISCCQSCGYGCNGGFMGASWQYWVAHGISSGGPIDSHQCCHPYPVDVCSRTGGKTVPTPACSTKCQPYYNVTDDVYDRRYGSVAYRIHDWEYHIMAEIYENGPVQVDFDIYEDFFAYKGGVYRHVTGKKENGHAVKLIGWGVANVNGYAVKYWLAANSWGPEWGERGFFRIVRGENHCGIEKGVYAGLPDYHKHKRMTVE
ncbi:cathepsin B-like [Uranotaenia lowii]|uniref:cathepsin B-like n=1 Tax=Uranotaenia lowii TaxID=190385 RepID=UPI00247A431A|nr:cathepsin B-like [Uranotaenia lowii]